jgi:phospholipase/carboxylesterase
MALRSLSGPRLPPVRGPATHLVVLVHGYGADGNDLISLAGHWRSLLPTTAFVAPNAPDRVPGSQGYQWFGLTRMDPHELDRGVNSAGPLLDAFLTQELARLGLGADRLALVGFSQGTMLSLHVGLGRSEKPAAIVGFSGLLAAAPPTDGAAPPIFLAHGSADQVIPVQAMFAAAAELGVAGAAVQWYLAVGMGHGIDPVGLDMAGQFLSLAFRGLLQRQGPVSSRLGSTSG